MRLTDKSVHEFLFLTAWALSVAASLETVVPKTSNNRDSLQGWKQFGEKKNMIGVSVWNTFLFLSKILHPSNDTDILNGPLGLCVTWLMMINCARNNVFSLQKVLPSLPLASFPSWFPMKESRRVQKRHSSQQNKCKRTCSPAVRVDNG